MQRMATILALMLMSFVMVANAYVPLLDEVEGLNGNNGHYLVLPAWENLDPAQKERAYFIIPKVVVIAGNADSAQPEFQFGAQHRGYTLFANGTADYPPSIDFLATVTLLKEDKAIQAIRDELTKRDVANGFKPPVFPDVTFEKWEGSVLVGGVASPTALAPISGGYPGAMTPLHVVTPTDAMPGLILELPSAAGRDAALWGISFTGTVPGYANRLDCEITIHHKKVYDHFKAQASGRAYWGLVKGAIGTEVKSLDQDQSIDFGKCRGKPDQIDKIVMPVWLKITEIGDQDGNKMFADMVKSLNGIPNHPEASSFGWGFEASAGWEKVSYNDQTKINFNIAFRDSWQLPFGAVFNTTCSKWKRYFINNTNNSKPCVDPSDFSAIREKQRQCNEQFLADIASYPPAVQAGAFQRLRAMGCAWDGSFGNPMTANMQLTARESAAGRSCRGAYLKLLSGWVSSGKIKEDDLGPASADISFQGCNWRPTSLQASASYKERLREFESARKALRSLIQN